MEEGRGKKKKETGKGRRGVVEGKGRFMICDTRCLGFKGKQRKHIFHRL